LTRPSIPLVNPHVTIDDAVAEALQTIRSRGHAIYSSGIATTSVCDCVDLQSTHKDSTICSMVIVSSASGVGITIATPPSSFE
jgi:hypothetical protein